MVTSDNEGATVELWVAGGTRNTGVIVTVRWKQANGRLYWQ